MENIKDKNVMITGAASGIGYQYAENLLKNGAKCVAVLDLSTSPGANSVATLEKEFGKGKAIFFPCDVSDETQLTETFKKVLEKLNVLDIVINNAGILNDRCMEKTINLNVVGLMRSTFLAMDHMGKHKGGKGGTIVNIASIVGLWPFGSVPIYTASKFAVMGFTRAIKESYPHTGIRFLVMCPGVTHTPLVADIETKSLDFITPEFVDKELNTLPSQPIDNVALAMVDLIEKGKNGDVWVSEGGQPPYAVDMPHYSKVARTV